nr:S-methyl-5'-thioadenosine phosphorylase [Pseudogemmobacter hezensis]
MGGVGRYFCGNENGRWQPVTTPWGQPSDQILTGELGGLRIAFLPRHGRGHVHSPSSVPYRANIDALKRIGCTDLLAVSAVGSLREDLTPGQFVLVDQLIDRTFARDKSFFGQGMVAHLGFAHPTCARLGGLVTRAAEAAGIHVHQGATYLAMEGPQFSTLAESRLYRSWGTDLIGMTAMPEAKLAREAELCYASLAMVTDYDCWHPDHDAVDVAAVIAVLAANADKARAVIAALPATLTTPQAAPLTAAGGTRLPCPCGCDRALDTALVTAPSKRDPAVLAKLDAVAGRLL